MTEPTGYTALDLIGFTDQGEYDSSTAYVKNDLVHYNNSIWRCLVDDTTAQTPTEGTYWTIFVEDSTAASGISYDGTDSGLSATNVQDAIDEVVDEKADSTIISDAYNSSTTYAVGDYFIYDNTLYHVDVACTGITPPNISYYTATSVSSEISNLDTDVSNLASGAHTYVFGGWSSYTSIVDVLDTLNIGITYSSAWSIPTITDLPTGISSQKTFIFNKVSNENVYNSIIIYSQQHIYYGYFTSNSSAINWATIIQD